MDGNRAIRRQIKDGDEHDVFTGWRKLYVYTQRAGVTSWVKRKARRRERREGKAEARREAQE